MDKLCKDCKHYVFLEFNPNDLVPVERHRCFKEKNISLVTGEEVCSPKDCSIERADNHYSRCSTTGKYFKRKE